MAEYGFVFASKHNLDPLERRPFVSLQKQEAIRAMCSLLYPSTAISKRFASGLGLKVSHDVLL